MLGIEEVKKLLPEEDKNLSNQEIAQIRDACQGFAELALEIYRKNPKIREDILTKKN